MNKPSVFLRALAIVSIMGLAACTTTKQNAAVDFKPPEGSYKVIVMRPDVSVSLLTAGGQLEPRQDWTDQARTNLLKSLDDQQARRGGTTVVVHKLQDAGMDQSLVTELDKLHEAVGQAILMHKYNPMMALPTKQNAFDWTLGESATRYGKSSGYDYALFLFARDSFSSGGRVALQAVGMLGCVVGVCVIPAGGSQVAFASLVDLKSGQVVWFNHLYSSVGDIREQQGADDMVAKLLETMQAASPPPDKS